MKKYLKRNIINLIIFVLKFIIVLALIILEYLSGYKRGLMHHLYYRKMEYLSKIYTGSGMMLHLIIILFLLLLMLYIYKKKCKNINKLNVMKYILYSILLIIAFYLPYLRTLNTYAYILMFLEISIGIQLLKIIINELHLKH